MTDKMTAEERANWIHDYTCDHDPEEHCRACLVAHLNAHLDAALGELEEWAKFTKLPELKACGDQRPSFVFSLGAEADRGMVLAEIRRLRSRDL